jgi:hypothetical protein
MKTRKSIAMLFALFLVATPMIFLSCSAGNPSEEGHSGGGTRVSGTLSGAGGEALRNFASAPLANYKLYCATTQSPIVEGTGTADANGVVTVALNVDSGTMVCSVLDSQGNRIAILIFSDSSGTNQSQAMSGGGDIGLGAINTNLATGEAHATLPAGVTIASVTAPVTTITSKPENPSDSEEATFSFSSDQANSSFECKLGSGPWTPCTSPKTYTGLTDGQYTFQVRAKSPSGVFDLTPESYAWTVSLTPPDTTPPETTILTKPPMETESSSATFTFSCNEDSCTFECRLDSSPWTACTSPKNYTVTEGSHTFSVKAIDGAGNPDPSPAIYSWTYYYYP